MASSWFQIPLMFQIQVPSFVFCSWTVIQHDKDNSNLSVFSQTLITSKTRYKLGYLDLYLVTITIPMLYFLCLAQQSDSGT